jgi:hypothetical protein
MLTHEHKIVKHLVVLAHLQRRWSLRGREGFGFLSPSPRACEAGFGVFMEMKCIFSTTPKAENFSKSSWIKTAANGGHWNDRTLDRTRSRHNQRVRSVAVAVRGTGR